VFHPETDLEELQVKYSNHGFAEKGVVVRLTCFNITEYKTI